MILEFKTSHYIDVDSIKAMRYFEDSTTGVIFIGSQKMTVSLEEFNIIEKAYRWLHATQIYDKDLRKGGKE